MRVTGRFIPVPTIAPTVVVFVHHQYRLAQLRLDPTACPAYRSARAAEFSAGLLKAWQAGGVVWLMLALVRVCQKRQTGEGYVGGGQVSGGGVYTTVSTGTAVQFWAPLGGDQWQGR